MLIWNPRKGEEKKYDRDTMLSVSGVLDVYKHEHLDKLLSAIDKCQHEDGRLFGEMLVFQTNFYFNPSLERCRKDLSDFKFE